MQAAFAEAVVSPGNIEPTYLYIPKTMPKRKKKNHLLFIPKMTTFSPHAKGPQNTPQQPTPPISLKENPLRSRQDIGVRRKLPLQNPIRIPRHNLREELAEPLV